MDASENALIMLVESPGGCSALPASVFMLVARPGPEPPAFAFVSSLHIIVNARYVKYIVSAACHHSQFPGAQFNHIAGAMLKESMIALVWAAGGVAFYGATGGLFEALSSLGQSGTAYDISTGMLGSVGGVLTIIGVVACPSLSLIPWARCLPPSALASICALP